MPAGVINNLLAMYGIYCSNYLLALVTVPYLTRTLGPASWGTLAAVQSFGGCLLLGVEFGFTFSGTRAAARARDDEGALRNIVSSVMGAKLSLALLCCVLGFIVEQCLPLFRNDPRTFWWGVAWATLCGANLMWFFQALERMRLVATLDLSIRALAVAATFRFVHGPGDAWRAIALQAAASLFSLLMSMVLVQRAVGFIIPSRSDVWHALRNSAATFVPRNASVLYTVGNTFLLGFFARPEIVGFYAGADRICRAVVGLLAPASEAVYPRISHVAANSRTRALRLARLSAVIMITIGALMGAALYVFAPLCVRILLGRGYGDAVAPLRIMSILPPLVAFRNIVAIHWMLPLDMESELNKVMLTCGALNVGLAILIAPHFGGIGMAWVVVASTFFASLGAWLVLRWKRLDPFGADAEKTVAAHAPVVPYSAQPIAE
jgi:PST family polysaccharide transporter